MRLTPDKTGIIYNETFTAGGIPPEAFGYKLGNRSALEWVLDQYQVTEDKGSGIISDPNNPDDPEYIRRLIGQVIHVSLKTLEITAALPNF
jgi:predicted helicase